MEPVTEISASVMLKCVILCDSCLQYLIAILIAGLDTFLFGLEQCLTGLVYRTIDNIDYAFRVGIQISDWAFMVLQTIVETFQTIMHLSIHVILDKILCNVSENLITIVNNITYVIHVLVAYPFQSLQLIISYIFLILINCISAIDYVVFGFVFPVVEFIFCYGGILFALFCVVFVVNVIHDTMNTPTLRKYAFVPIYFINLFCFIAGYFWRFAWTFLLNFVINPFVYLFCFGGVCCVLVIGIEMTIPRIPYLVRGICFLLLIIVPIDLWLAIHTMFRKIQHLYKERSKNCINYDFNEDSTKECVICFEERTFVTILPCMHANMCRTCVFRVKEDNNRCPLCRGEIIVIKELTCA
ncbi:uncharacterized protein LOC127862770 [Dreissena polymorpha]|uniref:uncharacterized protein LOC127862770 n=1 Tax=Dreissena polymorpha TaxID=45954 RepID=UPI002264DD1B|nr:uncharacterized protein LOC127862770 [Dreissena polymorpha]XP_052257990.1 uncharacterized protein LOC127862770 [Dreissena polymorpha]XP_052257991.1 uncharacterized protein LOC127862770 [Dreissena polymorpha]XP_052257992.1 uncharacterized protein LOC127862770 [Dreissena polymorpha]XP_052257993.1 uncharacterized protein LOC127862770 [Dreissena polymorpha]XP_052257994.1 uncharacterized protein LOC127862770 [Dreissena polymorpha]XP_052257995.1 uncharacterized protein LOC127862770 [Dreissena po